MSSKQPKRTGKPAKGVAKNFILNQPDNMPAKDVVEKGTAVGVKFSSAYVYLVRREIKSGKVEKPQVALARVPPTAVSMGVGESDSEVEWWDDTLKAAMKIGIRTMVHRLNAVAAKL